MASSALERGAAAVLDKVAHLGQVVQATRRILAEHLVRPAQDVEPARYIEAVG
jgi:hypothetical protein